MSTLKDYIVEFVGNEKEPENDEVTIDHVVEVMAEHFPELVLKIAEENWINGYSQALKDVDFMSNKKDLNNEEQDNVIKINDQTKTQR